MTIVTIERARAECIPSWRIRNVADHNQRQADRTGDRRLREQARALRILAMEIETEEMAAAVGMAA
ncbi:hypothetical protein E2A64_10095 [Pseudohoeflea suaedae]|uniref:Uncharacterized protein n=1 Tax=Pseudohoeflea suaedae TaxID=877384 RepID=A0A4V3A6Z7_9HYPH|nr:hypothetical protein [Pseudohoeflea suaedae]TDH35682.1 hypothetical protein E2A64_10095 [Pseudohoeflea suaedae]